MQLNPGGCTNSTVRRTALLAIVVLAAGCGGDKTATTPASPTLSFGYDAATPLRYVDHGVVLHHGPVKVHDVSFVSRGKRVDAYLVEGKADGASPAVVLVHGGGGDRTELLGDAVELARLGFVALTVTEPSSAYPPAQPTNVQGLVDESKAVTVDDVVAVRRAADVLASSRQSTRSDILRMEQRREDGRVCRRLGPVSKQSRCSRAARTSSRHSSRPRRPARGTSSSRASVASIRSGTSRWRGRAACSSPTGAATRSFPARRYST